jgi:protease-4
VSGASGASRTLLVAAGALLGGVVGAGPFLVVPWLVEPDGLAAFLGVVATLGAVAAGGRLGASLARRRAADYNVAEVAVEGPISRDGGGGLTSGPVGTTAGDVVEQVERAGEDPAVEGLLVRLNTPGGEVVPSEDVRAAVAAFDGPTLAYAVDTCASGGYWIAAGCDEVIAREGSVVGSIGVIGSRPNVAALADRLGVSYERFAAGRFKDAGLPLKELSDAEREYLQGIVDGYYDQFVERVSEGRDLPPAAVRDTEARVFLGPEAVERGLVDAVGDRDDVEERLGELVGAPARVEPFEPSRRLRVRLSLGAAGERDRALDVGVRRGPRR